MFMKLCVADEKKDARAALDLARLRSDPVLLLLSRTGSTPLACVTTKSRHQDEAVTTSNVAHIRMCAAP
jgi:hypothetical protein